MDVFKAGGHRKEKISNHQQTGCRVKHDKSLLFILSCLINTWKVPQCLMLLYRTH